MKRILLLGAALAVANCAAMHTDVITKFFSEENIGSIQRKITQETLTPLESHLAAYALIKSNTQLDSMQKVVVLQTLVIKAEEFETKDKFVLEFFLKFLRTPVRSKSVKNVLNQSLPNVGTSDPEQDMDSSLFDLAIKQRNFAAAKLIQTYGNLSKKEQLTRRYSISN